MKITLTCLQRLSLDSLIGAQQGTLDEIFLLHDIREKLQMSRSSRAQYFKVLANGTVMADEEAIATGEPLEIELEKAESRKVLDLLKTWRNFGEADIAWVAPLKKALES